MSPARITNVDDLLPFAYTDRQREILQAVSKAGGINAAGRALGITGQTVQLSVAAVKKRAAVNGWSPDHDFIHPVPDGFVPKGNSTLYDGEGNVVMQWVKTDRDRERMEEIYREIITAMSSEIPREKAVAGPRHTSEALLNFYPITDFHLGMYAWAEETGADWDTTIAENLLVDWFSAAIRYSPPAQRAVLAQLGDFLHWDGMEAVTPEHRNILDSDTRFELIVRVAIRVLRRVVRMLLKKHEHLHIIMAEGNHDPASSVWLREWFAALYEDDPRVTVDRSPSPYHCVEFGKTSIFVHHGHKKTITNVDDVFAAQFRDVFGRTKHSYAHVGHKHTQALSETNLMVVESHRTLAAPDAYASRGGWVSGRSASVITYHREHGEVGRVVIGPEMTQS